MQQRTSGLGPRGVGTRYQVRFRPRPCDRQPRPRWVAVRTGVGLDAMTRAFVKASPRVLAGELRWRGRLELVRLLDGKVIEAVEWVPATPLTVSTSGPAALRGGVA